MLIRGAKVHNATGYCSGCRISSCEGPERCARVRIKGIHLLITTARCIVLMACDVHNAVRHSCRRDEDIGSEVDTPLLYETGCVRGVDYIFIRIQLSMLW